MIVARSAARSDFRSVRRALVLILVAAAASAAPRMATAADPERMATITVRVYQTADLSYEMEQKVLSEAEAVLRTAAVDVQWRMCTPAGNWPRCEAVPESSDLILRIVRTPGAPNGDDTMLGAAVVDRRGGGGVLATVYVDHAAVVARDANSDVGVLLGRVAAHELGHLITRTSAHSPRGLMRALWRRSEIQRNRAEDWAFTAGDVAVMRRTPGVT